MATTYEPIATTTLASTSSSITLSSIPATYTDLRIVVVGTTASSTTWYFRFNGDTGANYGRTELQGTGASLLTSYGASTTEISWQYTNNSASVPNFCSADVFSYAGSTFKSCLTTTSQDANGSGNVGINAGIWRSTSAINSVTVFNTTTTFSVGTVVTIYGIKAA